MQTKDSLKKCQKDEMIYPNSVQLAGCDPEVMAQAAKLNEELGADIIDINYGCPVKKVVNGMAGSALMKDEDLAARIVDAVVRAVKIPVTVKMRMGWNRENLNAPSLAKKCEDLGAKMITIHGRTRCQMYTGNAAWGFVKNVKDTLTIPVIVNGDIKNSDDARTALEQSDADGVMVGRGAYGKPWLIEKISRELKGEIYQEPTRDELRDIVLNHFKDMVDHYGERTAIPLARKHIGWYSAGIPESAQFRAKVNITPEYEDVKKMIEEFF